MHYNFPFPISMENIPRQKEMCCLSLKFGTILTANVVLLYSVIGIAECSLNYGTGILETESEKPGAFHLVTTVFEIFNHVVTFALAAVMLVGVLTKRLVMIKPWVVWTSIQVTVIVMSFIFFLAVNSSNYFAEPTILAPLVQVILLMIRMYMLTVVAGYCREMEDWAEEQRLKQLKCKKELIDDSE